MKKPRKQIKTAWDYHEIVNYVQQKHNVDLRDFAGKFHGIHSFDAWCDSKGYGKIDPEGKTRGSSQVWCAEHKVDIERGHWYEPPYQDFWHWLLDVCEIRNGCYFYLPISYFKVKKPLENQKWIVKILKMFEEFKDEDGKVFCWVSW